MNKYLHSCLGVILLLSACQGVSTSSAPSTDCSKTTAGCSTNNDTLSAPSELEASASSQSSIHLTWQSPTYKSAYSITIEMKKEGDADFAVLETLGNDDESYDVTGLSTDTTYFFRLKSTDGTTVTDYSTVIDAKTSSIAVDAIYPKPTIKAVNQSLGVVRLNVTWSNTNSQYVSVKQFEYRKSSETVWHSFSPAEQTANAAYLDNAPQEGTLLYRIRVQYTNLAVYTSANSNAISAKLIAPTSLSVETVTVLGGAKKHSLKWSYGTSTTGVSGFKVNAFIQGTNYGPTTLVGTTQRAFVYLPSSCPSGTIVGYSIVASSSNALVKGSDLSNSVTIECP